MGHPSTGLEENSAQSNVDYGRAIQKVSEKITVGSRCLKDGAGLRPIHRRLKQHHCADASPNLAPTPPERVHAN